MNGRTVLLSILLWTASGVVAAAAQPPSLWIDVPFVAQAKDGCGSATISMILRYWTNHGGHAASDLANPERIQSLLYSPATGGIPASRMEEYLRSAGYRVFAFRGDWSDLKHHIEAGRPLVVSLKASGPWGPLHYVVVVGVDAERGFVYLNDPAQQKLLRISREGFESEWNPTKNWTLLALPTQSD